MENENNSYRIRTEVGSSAPNVLNVKLDQSYEFLNILSLKIGQENLYKTPASPYGVVVGRVLANHTFGIENAKVSIFVPKEEGNFTVKDDTLYMYSTSTSTNYDGIRYNLLPSYVDEECHQNVGTMYEKEYLIDNGDIIQVFDKYYTYTTRTNASGDYFIYGVPVGQHTLHVDVDLSDIGKLSVRPHDMIGQGYNIGMFESPNKFKADKNLNILPQIKTQDKPIQVFPFWGDTSDDDTNAMITRADIEIDYKFEPTAVFMGSIITDKGSNSISHKCVPNIATGKMSELATGQGKIEMIRKTFDGKVEEFSVKGNRLIDSNGVWCYQVPMNLDYVGMDEFGNIVPTDDPNKGLPTRARVRFRISMDEDPMDDSARKRARFLVPNNPRLTDDYPNFMETLEADYNFGTFTKDESYRDLFWNNVYTVKSYIPRLQKRATANTKKFTGIKMTNHPGDNNPMPYNNLSIKMNFMYRFLCPLMYIFFTLVKVLNTVLSYVGIFLGWVGIFMAKFVVGCAPISGSNDGTEDGGGDNKRPLLRAAVNCVLAGLSIVIKFNGNICEDGDTPEKEVILGNENAIKRWVNFFWDNLENPWVNEYQTLCYTGSKKKYVMKICGSSIFEVLVYTGGDEKEKINANLYIKELKKQADSQNTDPLVTDVDDLMNCVQSMLAQENEVTSFNFHNDWINGVLYAPLWYRKIKPRRKIRNTNLQINRVDDWCNGDSVKDAAYTGRTKKVKLAQTCSQQRRLTTNEKAIRPIEEIYVASGVYYNPVNNQRENTERDCYGLKCHKKTVSFIKVDDGIIIKRETKYGDYVYYYKSVEYSEKGYIRNILDGDNTELGEVKLLFATDLVLLGSLNECDINGVPQFFRHLTETTYQMPPDLVSVTWDNLDDKANNATEEDDDYEIDPNSIRVEYTGSDYGNIGYEQFIFSKESGSGYTRSVNTKERPGQDSGGLFYDLTCFTSNVPPKGCVNLSRICELGVSLDQSIDLIKNDGSTEYIPPDGFVSYDELYNMDARAMFSTMNANNLREKTNPSTGYLVYDFNYNYPENFDGTLQELMKRSKAPVDEFRAAYADNWKLEKSSNSYLRFRYGFDKDRFKVAFYNAPLQPIALPEGAESLSNYGYTDKNERRFPRYENSFYFYFGLKSGSTALNKFMEQFYSDCHNDEASEDIVGLKYKANSWCNSFEDIVGDGYVAFDLRNLVLPCSISFNELTEGEAYDVDFWNIHSYKVYIGAYNQVLESQGYTRLYVDSENMERPDDYDPSETYTAPYIHNGRYRITITDYEENEFVENITMAEPKLSFTVNSVNFTLSLSELENIFTDPDIGTRNHDIAYDNTVSVGNPLYRDIGGYVTISSIANVSTPLTDNFIIRVGSENHIEGYDGSEYRKINGQVTTYGVPPLNVSNGAYSFAVVPLPNEPNQSYVIRVTEFCPNYNMESENTTEIRVTISEATPFKMFVNGVDVSLLSEFKTGYVGEQNNTKLVSKPYNGYNKNCGIGYVELNGVCIETQNAGIKGWDDIGNVGVYSLIPIPTVMIPYSEISNIVDVLSPVSEDNLPVYDEVYSFTDEYRFRKSDVDMGIPEYSEVPDINTFTETPPKYIKIINEQNPDGIYYEFNSNTQAYNIKSVNNVSLSEYFSTTIEAQVNVINELNAVIQRRLDLVYSVYEAFCVTSDDPKSVTITYDTSELPVKTLIYKAIDSSVPIINNQFYLGTRYIIYDMNKEDNYVPDFGFPTITVRERMASNTEDTCIDQLTSEPKEYPEYYPVFAKVPGNNPYYRFPLYCAIKNGIGTTVPSDIGTLPFGDNVDVTEGVNSMDGGMNGCMFGVNMIDKKPFTRLNVWIPIKNYPIYWPDIDETDLNGVELGYVYTLIDSSDIPSGVTPENRNTWPGDATNIDPEYIQVTRSFFKKIELGNNTYYYAPIKQEEIPSDVTPTPELYVDDNPTEQSELYIVVSDLYYYRKYYPPEGIEKGGYLNMNGCLSGYLYNCFSTSSSFIASFERQDIGEGKRVELYTLSQRGSLGIPDEYAIPTKRVLYSQPKDEDTYVYSYNDFEKPTETDGWCEFDYGSRPYDTTGVDTSERYISFGTDSPSINISDRFTDYSESLGTGMFFGIPEDTIIGNDSFIHPVLIDDEGNEVSVHWRIFDAQNPIFKKAYKNSHMLIDEIILDAIGPNPDDNRLSMLYGWDDWLPDYEQILPATKRFFIVGRTYDEKFRAISPTYEISEIKVRIGNSPEDSADYCVDVLFVDGDETEDYYLRYYPYKIFIKEEFPLGAIESYESDLVEVDYDDLDTVNIDGQSYKYKRTSFLYAGIPASTQGVNVSVTVKDVTGIIRMTEIIDTF